jgi:hypothetical protein
MAILCERIAVEQNLTRFTHWLAELNELLARKEHRLELERQSTTRKVTPKS